jgi:hypothetical protein
MSNERMRKEDVQFYNFITSEVLAGAGENISKAALLGAGGISSKSS